MRCDQFEQRWQALLDQRHAPEDDPALQAHAALCDECYDLLQLQACVFNELARSGGKSLARQAIQVSARPTQHALPPAAPTRAAGRGTWSRWACGIAIAGSLLLLAIPGWRHSARGLFNRFASSPQVVSAVQPGSSPFTPVPSPEDSQHPLVPPTTSAAEQEALRNLMVGMSATFSSTTPEQPGSLEWMKGGFRPLAETLNVAWDALQQTIPVTREGNGSEPQATKRWLDWQNWPIFQA